MVLVFVAQRVKLCTMAQRRKRTKKVIKLKKRKKVTRKKERHRCPLIVQHFWFYAWKRHSKRSDNKERNDSKSRKNKLSFLSHYFLLIFVPFYYYFILFWKIQLTTLQEPDRSRDFKFKVNALFKFRFLLLGPNELGSIRRWIDR